jgi:hypothetical protein
LPISFSEPRTTIIGNDELFIEAGSTINLTCTIQTGPTTDALIYWNYNGKVRPLAIKPKNPFSGYPELAGIESH